MKIGFEILHYQSVDETINCVDSIRRYIPHASIVIVDNASPNKSGEILKKKYTDSCNIEIIQLHENLGFARGNNAGYQYLREDHECEFICCINNDTLIKNDFTVALLEEYEKSRFGILAPLVRLKDGSIQSFNPIFHDRTYYLDELKSWEDNNIFEAYLAEKDFLTRLIFMHPLITSRIRKIKQHIKCKYGKRMENVVLHGCFLIFSPDYINKFDTAFCEDTFMYREEELLFLRAQNAQIKTVYSPNIEIIHLEDSATDSIYKSSEEKYEFIRNNQINSLHVLLNEIGHWNEYE